jgi:protein-tyrosine phosphatase
MGRSAQQGRTMEADQKTVLFLCTGNYYRSRFAELLFNHLARGANLSWRAVSRGLALERGAQNIGPIAVTVLTRLRSLAVPIDPVVRIPRQLAETELTQAHLVIALKEAEHRPLIGARFPAWEHRIEYWHIHDVDCGRVEDTLDGIEQQARLLVARLRDLPLGSHS